ncbi:hypothetical protein B0H63DRAFT_83670 [Podospora didyma]|uniref:Rhodopsin domain-containing protein n=1 Tax=Podospora didyma TaxID=330526 RepID=A0AAE0N1M0_9PEZI|nr:hypothetical protein B0H63DRAFT_83670 [Podospora didyma]
MAAFVNGVPVVMPPPEGYVVDFDNPERNSVTEAYWLFAVGNLLSLLFVLQRVYVKIFVQRRIQLEDVCLLVAYVFSVVLQTLIIRDFARGIMGTHAWEMPLPKFLLFLQALYQLPILYNPVQCGAKLALLLLYRRLAPQRWFQILVWSVMFVVVGSSVGIMFAAIFPCRPVSAAWDITIAEFTCINRVALYEATAILGAITDVMVLAVPIPIVVTLQIPRRQKIGLVALFSIGAITVFTSIMRLVALINSMGNTDQSWGGGVVLLWIFAEANLSIICGAMPTIKPFLRHISPRLLGSSRNKSSNYADGGKSGQLTPNAPPTFGGTGGESSSSALKRNTGGGRYDKYHRFDDGMYPLETVVAVGADRDTSLSDDDGRRGDNNSERAIVQTRTATVSYETA